MTVEEHPLTLYAAVLDEIRVRGEAAAEILLLDPSYPRLETAALQMRMILELIPLGALVTHRDRVANVLPHFNGRLQTKLPSWSSRSTAAIGPSQFARSRLQTVAPLTFNR